MADGKREAGRGEEVKDGEPTLSLLGPPACFPSQLHTVSKKLRSAPISFPSCPRLPRAAAAPSAWQGWVCGDRGILNPWTLYSEVNLQGRASSPKNSTFIHVWQRSAGVGLPKGTVWVSK